MQERHHYLVLENEYIRVFRVEIPPGDATAVHTHSYPHVYISLDNAEIANEVPGKAPVASTLEAGETRIVKARAIHRIRNLGQRPFVNLTIELKRDSGSQVAFSPAVEEFKFDSGASGDLFELPNARGYIIHVSTGGEFKEHRHEHARLMAALTECDLQIQDSAGVKPLRLRKGDVAWFSEKAVHSVRNTGREPAVFVVLEFR